MSAGGSPFHHSHVPSQAVPAAAHGPELLAPAGDWDCAKAAVANGANAIYFGLDCGFNARARAANFQVDDLKPLLLFLHRHEVRGYVTLNTLAFSDELESLETLIRQIAEAGVDAVLVQDLGLARLVREIAPTLSIHASTQMTMTSAECIAAIDELGMDRVVVARELSVREIAKIHERTNMPLEAFVHGALCVAYSGQCLTSESLGGRSANRGQCAQACRLPYELVCDDVDVDLDDRKYLLSPQDLAAYALIPDLIAAGVVSLKIEGRLKTPEYVANITRHYRQAIDSAITGHAVEFSARQIDEMELSFSRGFSVGWLQGCDHKMLVPATSSSKRGVLLGTVQSVDSRQQRVRIQLQRSLKAGDGVVFEGDRSSGNEQGGRVFSIQRDGRRLAGEVHNGLVDVDFPRDAVDFQFIRSGLSVWKTDDPALTRKLRKSFAGNVRGADVAIVLSVSARVGEPLVVSIQSPNYASFQLSSDQTLETAIRHPLTIDVLRQQFGRLGGTGFRLGELTADIIGSPMVPLSVLGQLRRTIVERLHVARDTRSQHSHSTASSPVLPSLRFTYAKQPVPGLRHESPPDESVQPDHAQPRLKILCRSLHQLNVLLDHGVDWLYADFQDIREYREAIRRAQVSGASLHPATPRIQKPNEMGIFALLARHQPDGVLVRNLAGLEYFVKRCIPCVADFSLNAANELTVDWLLQHGADRITASYDLNRDQLLRLAEHCSASDLEVVIHQHMPMFHMEHCVFCAVLSPGTNKTNCGRPCDVHEVRLRDRTGNEHPLKADVGCRNTLFNRMAQSGAEVVKPLLSLGVREFRIELLNENTPAEIGRVVNLYRDLLDGRVSAHHVWSTLKAANRVGVTRGTLEHGRDPLAIL